ncbi:unnamed protein product [Peniophora sp. CBMAI 1063]|nr:unnamed protein product [Peniophora sp. CBMAI 1063]
MVPTDPTFPLVPVANLLCAVGLLALLIVNFVRRSHAYNFAVNILALALFFETLFIGINAIIWADNADLKAFVYCDIVTHVQVFSYIAKPACTLLITRQLYHVTTSRSLDNNFIKQRRRDITIELAIGVGLPVLVAGALYYIVQPSRFMIVEAFGCFSVSETIGLSILLMPSWIVTLPLFSAIYYCPRIIRFFMGRRKLHAEAQSQEFDNPRQAWHDGGVRLLILGCLDIILTLPMGAFNLGDGIYGAVSGGDFIFYPGWAAMHADWAPFSYSYAELKLDGRLGLIEQYMAISTSVILGYAIIALFGFAKPARAVYGQLFWAIISLVGIKPPERQDPMADGQSLHFKTNVIESTAGDYTATAPSGGPPTIGAVTLAYASTFSLGHYSKGSNAVETTGKDIHAA